MVRDNIKHEAVASIVPSVGNSLDCFGLQHLEPGTFEDLTVGEGAALRQGLLSKPAQAPDADLAAHLPEKRQGDESAAVVSLLRAKSLVAESLRRDLVGPRIGQNPDDLVVLRLWSSRCP